MDEGWISDLNYNEAEKLGNINNTNNALLVLIKLRVILEIDGHIMTIVTYRKNDDHVWNDNPDTAFDLSNYKIAKHVRFGQ